MKLPVFFFRLCGVVALGVLVGCQESKPPAESPPSVKLEEVASTDGVGSRFTASVRQESRATLAFEGGGRIASMAVDVGDHVHAGQVLASLDVTPSTYRLQQAEANAKAARAELTDRQSQLRRQQAQYRDGALSEVGMTSAQAAMDAAQAKVSASDAEVDLAKRAVRMAVIRAPFDGDVIARLQQPSNDVGAGQPVLQLEGSGRLQLVALLPSQVAASLSVGSSAQAYAKDLGAMIPVSLRGISARSEVSGTQEAIFDVEDEKVVLRSGSAVLLSLPVSGDRALSVPLTAVVRGPGDRAWVYVYDGTVSEVRRRAVKLGSMEGARIRIAQGLHAGEQVVGAGAFFMVDGQRVIPFQADTRLVEGTTR